MMMKQINIAVVGDYSVGKTSVINRLSLDQFTSNNQNQPFVDRNLTSGPVRFHFIENELINLHGVIIVFDYTNEESYRHVHDYVNYYQKICQCIRICCNKCDLECDYEFDEDFTFFEVSSKTGKGMNQLLYN